MHLNKFELSLKSNSTIKEIGQRFEFNCKAVDGKQFQSIRFYRNDQLIAESTNYVNYLSDQFINTTSLLSSKDLIEFRRSMNSMNNFTMNSIEQKLIIHKLNKNDAGHYQCTVYTAFGNASKKFNLKIQSTNFTTYRELINLIKVPNLMMFANSFFICLAIPYLFN